MPRIRTIKPDFFISDTVSALPLRARLTWIGLWTHCDDHGRCRDNVKLIKAAVWPLDDVSLRDITSDLADLETAGLIYRYTGHDGKQYLQVTNWAEHQKVDRPSKSTIPAPGELPPDRAQGELPPNTRDTLASPRESESSTRDSTSSPRDRKGKEGNGKEGTRAPAREEPPPKCPEHINNPNPPSCGACADFRRANAEWVAERGKRQRLAEKCAVHRGELAHNCGPCRADALAADDPPSANGATPQPTGANA